MKAFIPLFLLMLLTFSTNLFSQHLSAGVKGGLNISSMTVNESYGEYSSAMGAHLGGFIMYKVSEFSYEIDLTYSFQGAKVKSDGEYLRIDSRYFTIPVLVRYEFIPGVSIQAGPQVGFLCCVKSDYHPITKEPFDEQDYTSAYKKTDLGVIVGAGYQSGKWLFDARYYLGMTDIADHEGLAETKNRVFQASVGYKIYMKTFE
jgi:hypothetical protein